MTDFQKSNKIDKLEQKLYSTNSDIKQKDRSKMYEDEQDVSKTWVNEVNQNTENPLKKDKKKGMTWFSKIFIGAFVFFLIALAYTLFVFNFKPTSEGRNVNINVNSPISVSAGEEFTFDVVVENNNSLPMESIDLAIEYPNGTRDGRDISVDLPRERADIGSIDSGSFLRETKTVFLFGEEGETKEIEVKIVYRVPDSNAVFEKRKVFDVVLKSTPVRMNISSVKEVTSGQDLEFELELISNSNETIDNVVVQADYPFGFIFRESSIPTLEGTNTWLIKSIEPKEKIQFTVSGEMQGQDDEVRFFKFNSGLKDTSKNEIAVLFTSVGKTVEIERPFLEIDIAVEDDNSSVVNLKSDTSSKMTINYKNNTGEAIEDVEIILKIDGDVLDESSVQVSRGFYNSAEDTVIWDKSTFDGFESLGVGESGKFDITFRSKSLTGIERFLSPEISLSGRVVGTRAQDDDVPEEIVNEVVKKIRFNTVVLFDQNSLYYDGPFENTGSIPPKVEEETTYTINFALSNSSNRISNGVMEMTLPRYVKFEEQIWPSGTEMTYNSRERKITWNVGELKENIGYNADKIQGAFKVSIIPSISQKNQSPVLVDNIKFIGTDLFTGEQIVVNGESINTNITDRRNHFDGQVSQ
jgi:hypothetical protein